MRACILPNLHTRVRFDASPSPGGRPGSPSAAALLLYGGDMSSVAGDTTVLVAWLAGALALSSLAARWLRVLSVSRIKPELVL